MTVVVAASYPGFHRTQPESMVFVNTVVGKRNYNALHGFKYWSFGESYQKHQRGRKAAIVLSPGWRVTNRTALMMVLVCGKWRTSSSYLVQRFGDDLRHVRRETVDCNTRGVL